MPAKPFTDEDAAPLAGREGSSRIPVLEETATVGRQTVDQGGHRITKTVSHEPRTLDVTLSSSTVNVEHRPIGTPLPPGEPLPVTRYEGDVLVIPVIEEVLVTEKRLMLTEEVRVRRVETTRTETTAFSLRKEQVVIERLGVDQPSTTGTSSSAGHPPATPPASPKEAA